MLRAARIAHNAPDEVSAVKYTPIFTAPLRGCYRQPDQTIDPYMFAQSVDDAENYVTKATCLWTKGLPELVGTGWPKPDNEKLYGRNPNGKISCWEERQNGGKDRAKNRSKTFPGIATAIAEQWGAYLEELEE